MACFSKDCDFVKKNGGCFYDGVPPSNSPKTCEKCKFFKPITNADRIRGMSDEELAEFEIERMCCPPGKPGCKENNLTCDNCEQCWLDWLKQEAVSDG